MTPLAVASSITMMLVLRRLKMAIRFRSSSLRPSLTRPWRSRTVLVTSPMTISSSPSTQSRWPGTSSAAAMSRGARNSTRVCPALARRP
jgi:hypothetical protein